MNSPYVPLQGAGFFSWATSRMSPEPLIAFLPLPLPECAFAYASHPFHPSFPFNLSLILLRSCHTVQQTKVHHSAFCKPEAEHLGAHILSNLPCSVSGGDWCMNSTHRVRAEAFSDTNMVPVLARGSFESGTAVARDTSDARSSLMSLDDP
jgi:hypothetical protein